MLREQFNSIILKESNLGFQRGIDLFLESINDDLEKDSVLHECATKTNGDYIDYLFDTAITESARR